MSALRISHPGVPVRVIPDDPFLGLSLRQQEVMRLVVAHGGNRSAAARQLGITVQSVQAAVRIARREGYDVPAGRAGRLGRPDLRPRRRRAA